MVFILRCWNAKFVFFFKNKDLGEHGYYKAMSLIQHVCGRDKNVCHHHM